MERPDPNHINSWRAAEQNAVVWLRHWGYEDARLTDGGADGGIDVTATDALAQVKFEAHQTGRPALQRLLGAARRDDSKQLIFFSGVGFAQPAIEYANDVDMALFTYDLTGLMKPVNSAARQVVSRSEMLAKHEAEERERQERERAEAQSQLEIERSEPEPDRGRELAGAGARRAAKQEKMRADREQRKADAQDQADQRKHAAEQAISRGEMPSDSKAMMAFMRVLAMIVAGVWGWKAGSEQDSTALIWCGAFLVSAVFPARVVQIWPAVWPAWLGFLTYHFWTAPWPNFLRLPPTIFFALLTLLALGLWASAGSDYLDTRRRVAAARQRLAERSKRDELAH